MYINPYGLTSPEPLSPLEVELAAFIGNPSPEVGGLGKAEHFWKACEILWGPKSTKPFVRHPWAERMTAKACDVNYLGLSGCASSGKSDWGAVWGIVNWLAAPKDTLVFCTSTSLKESGKRIWGSIKAYYNAARLEGAGKLVESLHAIRTNDGSGVFNDKEGIFCIAGEKKDEKDAIGKLIGAKNKRVILIADELPELTEAILTAALSNLAVNPFFQMIALGNFKSAYDAFGSFIKPKRGYGSITVNDEEWETDTGLCIRFDGMKSPNILEGRDRWPIYDSKNLAQHKKALGEDSAAFWRMCRSFPAPIGTDDTLYSDSDFLSGRSNDKVPSSDLIWLGPKTRLSGLDPSYTNGGDRSIQWLAWWGPLTNGLWVLYFDKYMILRDSVEDPAPRDYQIVRQFRDNCKKEGVLPENAAFDGTAASGFASIMFEEWSTKVMRVEFGGAASDKLVIANDKRKAKDCYDRRVSELWGVGREFVRSGQLKGLSDDVCAEMKARKYETRKSGQYLLISVETKAKMKARCGFSPDLADGVFVVLELARTRHGALAGGVSKGLGKARSNFFSTALEKDRVYHELYATADTE